MTTLKSVRNLSTGKGATHHVSQPTQEKKMKKTITSNRGRAQFAFVKAVEPQAGIQAVVFQAIKKVKHGSVADIAQAALALGLKKVTSQNPLVQTHVHLNRLRILKAVKRIKVAA